MLTFYLESTYNDTNFKKRFNSNLFYYTNWQQAIKKTKPLGLI